MTTNGLGKTFENKDRLTILVVSVITNTFYSDFNYKDWAQAITRLQESLTAVTGFGTTPGGNRPGGEYLDYLLLTCPDYQHQEVRDVVEEFNDDYGHYIWVVVGVLKPIPERDRW